MYIGNDLQIAHPSYKIIDDISSGFNGSTTSFALQVSGATPVPFPISTQQVMISVNGVVQEPDPTGSAGFKLLGSNIVFSSAPANGHAFFGVINAGADYVTAGSEFPDGSATAPSFTFQDDQDTGWYRSGSGDVGYSSNGSAILNFDGNGLTIAAGKGLTVDTNTLKVDATNNRVGIGLTAPATNFHVKAASPILRLEDSTDPQGTDGSIGKIEFYGNDGSSGGVDVRSYIQTISTNSTGNAHALVIGLGLSNNAPTEKIRILGDGNIGIGTSIPSTLVHLKTTSSSADCDLQVEATGSNADARLNLYSHSGGVSQIRFGDQDDTNIGLLTYEHASNSMQFRTADNERVRIDNNGRLLLGHTTSIGEARAFQIVGTTADTSAAQLIRHSADSSSPGIDLTKSRNATKGSNTIVQNNDTLGQITFRGDDGTDFNSTGATIVASVDGTPGANDMPGRLVFSTTADGSNSETERMRIDSLGNVGIGGTPNFTDFGSNTGGLELDNVASSNTAVKISHDTTDLYLTADATRGYIGTVSNDEVRFITNGTAALTLDSSQNATFAGTVSDSKGNLRSIPQNHQTSAYVLQASDAGKCIKITTGGVTVNTSVFSSGDAVTIVNHSGSDQTITQGSSFTLHNTADATTGNRTLAGRGMATIWFENYDQAYISGAGLS